MAFKIHYLGPNNIGNMAATAEHKLINATDRREGRCWDFERYATLHNEQHTIIEGLQEYGYAGMDEGNKTRHLVANRILFNLQKSFWSCSHMNFCLQNTLHINLHT